MAVVNSKVGRLGLFLANPMVAKIDKVKESGEPSSTAKGITKKTIFFLLLTVVGVLIYLLAHPYMSTAYTEMVEGYEVNLIEAGIAFGSLILGLLGTFICFKFVRSAFFFGSLYSFAQGYFLTFLFHALGEDFLFPCLVALSLTLLLVFTMLILYRLKWVRIDKKFSSCIATLVVVGVLLTIIVAILNAIPQTKEYVQFIVDNTVAITISGIVGIIFATLLLLVDFSVIDYSLQEKLPKKYEWLSAFALSFSVIELYLKILNFVLRFLQPSNN